MLKAVLIDDEVRALDVLEILLNEVSDMNIIRKYEDAEDLFTEKFIEDADVFFLDIEMPNINGINLGKRIKTIYPQKQIVYVTAYNEYAVKAFEVDSTDYLLKPINKERLKSTVRRIYTNHKFMDVPSESDELIVNCFGEFTVSNKNNNSLQWKTTKSKELIAYLVSHRRGGLERDQIIENLWPQFDFEKGKKNLHTTVSYVNKNLKDLGVCCGVKYKSGKYIIASTITECDLYKLYSMHEMIDRINSSNIQEFEKLIELNINEFMMGMDVKWTENIQNHLIKLMTEVLHQVISYYKKNKMTQMEIKCYEKLLVYNPYNEEAYGELIQLYIINNNRVKAIQEYEKLKQILNDEIGVEPEKFIKDLVISII